MVSRMFALVVSCFAATTTIASAQAPEQNGRAVLTEAAKALGMVAVAETSGQRELTVPLPTGVEAKGVLDAAGLMIRVEIKIGAQLFTGDYSDYKDFQGYGVMFPTRIVQKLDGRTIAD